LFLLCFAMMYAFVLCVYRAKLLFNGRATLT